MAAGASWAGQGRRNRGFEEHYLAGPTPHRDLALERCRMPPRAEQFPQGMPGFSQSEDFLARTTDHVAAVPAGHPLGGSVEGRQPPLAIQGQHSLPHLLQDRLVEALLGHGEGIELAVLQGQTHLPSQSGDKIDQTGFQDFLGAGQDLQASQQGTAHLHGHQAVPRVRPPRESRPDRRVPGGLGNRQQRRIFQPRRPFGQRRRLQRRTVFQGQSLGLCQPELATLVQPEDLQGVRQEALEMVHEEANQGAGVAGVRGGLREVVQDLKFLDPSLQKTVGVAQQPLVLRQGSQQVHPHHFKGFGEDLQLATGARVRRRRRVVTASQGQGRGRERLHRGCHPTGHQASQEPRQQAHQGHRRTDVQGHPFEEMGDFGQVVPPLQIPADRGDGNGPLQARPQLGVGQSQAGSDPFEGTLPGSRRPRGGQDRRTIHQPDRQVALFTPEAEQVQCRFQVDPGQEGALHDSLASHGLPQHQQGRAGWGLDQGPAARPPPLQRDRQRGLGRTLEVHPGRPPARVENRHRLLALERVIGHPDQALRLFEQASQHPAPLRGVHRRKRGELCQPLQGQFPVLHVAGDPRRDPRERVDLFDQEGKGPGQGTPSQEEPHAPHQDQGDQRQEDQRSPDPLGDGGAPMRSVRWPRLHRVSRTISRFV